MSELNINKLKSLKSMIGETPLLEISFKYKGKEMKIYAKAEYYNLTGSIKDRMAYYVLKKAYEKNEIKSGDRIVEATSGNTGISFAAIGRALGHPVSIYMPDWMSKERINLIKAFGADIELVSHQQGGFVGSIEMTEKLARENANCFLPRQFSNPNNAEAHYMTTGPEIWRSFNIIQATPDAFIAGVGTGGTVMGVGQYLKERNRSMNIYPLEPKNSPTLSTGCKIGKHRIQGISDEFIPDIVDLNWLDQVISVDDGDAINMARKLSKDLGLGVGISSGANFLGAIMVMDLIGYDKIVVTVFSDDNKKYLSTDLMNDENIDREYVSENIQLVHYKAYRNVVV
ncbi:MAG: PLP-dependent cysteine synthase family protein [Bacillota bacterium]|nr:PLP-dependent cysteine synthase family protein [Bacillota bacterium]